MTVGDKSYVTVGGKSNATVGDKSYVTVGDKSYVTVEVKTKFDRNKLQFFVSYRHRLTTVLRQIRTLCDNNKYRDRVLVII